MRMSNVDRYDAENASARGKNKNKQISKDFKYLRRNYNVYVINKLYYNSNIDSSLSNMEQEIELRKKKKIEK